MAKQIIWSDRVTNDLLTIFEYWFLRNKSNNYSKKLNTLFSKSIDLIAHHSLIGRPTHIKNIKIKVIKHYQIIYEDIPELIIILTIWDIRRNPKEFNITLSK